jgi:DNA repair protein RecN (Recombination protein N)
MLSRLAIKNVALIESAEIEFGKGLNVLSGETGAGKSVILDSVNFVLGAKADKSMIRYGEEECLVKAEFIVDEESEAVKALRELDIDSNGEIIISRKFSQSGKNVIKINGDAVTATMLRSVTGALVDVHGQSEHFFLLKESNQLRALDNVIGEELTPLKNELALCLKEKRDIEQSISLLGGDEAERSRRLDILRYQIEEIQAVDVKEGEEDELLSKRNKIMHLEKIINALRDALSVFQAEDGVTDLLRGASRALSSITRLDESYSSLAEKIEGLIMDADDVAELLSDMGEELYFDENEAAEIEARLESIRALKRKYGADKTAIDAYLEKITAEHDLLSDCEGQYAILISRKEKNDKKTYDVCQKITKLRKERGFAFCQRVTKELQTLNIASAQFSIDFTEYCFEDVAKANANGLDDVCFMFSANAGEPLKPLGKIISGGEMSRFMLAIKTCLSATNEIHTYIFDEIDAGISGKTAKVVGEKMARIAKEAQIIAVSHLAQIAVMSDQEFLIEKYEKDGKTLTKVVQLDKEAQIQEIVRLLGGESGEDYARNHAEELLRHAQEYKNSIF